MLAFNETISQYLVKKLLEQKNLPDNCKAAQAKLVNPVIFSTVSLVISSTDKKLRGIQKDYSKVTACPTQLLARLSDIF